MWYEYLCNGLTFPSVSREAALVLPFCVAIFLVKAEFNAKHSKAFLAQLKVAENRVKEALVPASRKAGNIAKSEFVSVLQGVLPARHAQKVARREVRVKVRRKGFTIIVWIGVRTGSRWAFSSGPFAGKKGGTFWLNWMLYGTKVGGRVGIPRRWQSDTPPSARVLDRVEKNMLRELAEGIKRL